MGDTKYEYGADLSTEGVPLIDPGTGKTISLRVFHFKMNPELKHFPSDKQAIFSSHAQKIKTVLWGDGLVAIEDVAPRVMINKRNHTYDIIVPCEARLSTMFIDKPKNLSEELLKGKLEKPKRA